MQRYRREKRAIYGDLILIFKTGFYSRTGKEILFWRAGRLRVISDALEREYGGLVRICAILKRYLTDISARFV